MTKQTKKKTVQKLAATSNNLIRPQKNPNLEKGHSFIVNCDSISDRLMQKHLIFNLKMLRSQSSGCKLIEKSPFEAYSQD